MWIDEFFKKMHKLHLKHKKLGMDRHKWFGEQVDNLYHTYEMEIKRLLKGKWRK